MTLTAMTEVWLRSNRRVLVMAMVPVAVTAAIGWAIYRSEASAIPHWLGAGCLGLASLSFLGLSRQILQPRIAFRDGAVLFYLRAGGPIAVPVQIVEAFFQGEGSAHLPGEPHHQAKSVNLIARLSQRETDWHERDVKPALGRWAEGYVTVRGTWCEPITGEVIRRLNRRAEGSLAGRDVERTRWGQSMKHVYSPTPKLLVSVRNADEVKAALAGGADWIDLKEPNAGPLAPVDAVIARQAAEDLNGRRPLSAALGELREWDCGAAIRVLSINELSVVKLGLAGCAKIPDWQDRWLAIARQVEDLGKQLAAVIYADWRSAHAPSPREMLGLAREIDHRYLLVDTFNKTDGSTFDHLSKRELADILDIAKQAPMTTVLAGRMNRELLGKIPQQVDMVAVRGGVCCGDRTSCVEAQLVKDFRHALAHQFGKHLPAT